MKFLFGGGVVLRVCLVHGAARRVFTAALRSAGTGK